jgi:AP2-associated kinase
MLQALGCLLYRIAYLKLPFDGESKLQILNGNYRIPEAPRYSATVTDLIRDMLSASPDKRPDAMQVWRRINEALPSDVRKHLPDKPPSTPAGRPHTETRSHGQSKGLAVPSRSAPLPPSTPKDAERKLAQNGSTGTAAGAFWATSYAQDAKQDSDVGHVVESPRKIRSNSPGSRSRREDPIHAEKSSSAGHFLKKKSTVTSLIKKVQGSVQSAGGWGRDENDLNGYEMRLDSEDQKQANDHEVKGHDTPSASPVSTAKAQPSNDPAFNEFAAHFDSSATETKATSSKTHELQVELDRVNKELRQVLAEKAAVSSKYEKLTAFCHSQQREIQGLKNALNSTNSPRPSPKGGQSPSPVSPQAQTQRQAPHGWQAFDQVCFL